MKNLIHLNISQKNNRIVFLFSYPKQKKEKNKIGFIGENSDILFKYLTKKEPNYFLYINKYDYKIINT